MHLSKLPTGPHRRLLATLLAFVLFANIVFILYPTSPTSSAAPAVKPEAPAVKLIGNNPFQAEYDNNDPQSCNGLHPILRADLNETIPRHYALKGPKNRVVTIFLWRQQTYAMSNISWPELAKDLCPYPPELVAYFKAYWDRHVNDDYPRWPNGWAPCWLWKINSESDNLVRTCDGTGTRFKLTTNYTEFRDADIIHMDYVFYLGAYEHVLFWNVALLPPKLGGHIWWLNYGRESVAYYPYVRMESFLRNFDFTIGAPASLYDLSHPLEPITSNRLKLMIAAPPPTIRSDGIQLAWMVSNCSPRNQRNEVMKGLMEEMEVHSFGRCMHNMDFPEEIKLKFKLTEEVSNDQYWGPWQDIKREIFAGYPFVFVPENSNCEGYVTEKVYDALAAGSIPIYLGARDIDNYVPPHSIINVVDFANVTALANHIKKVTNSTELRMEYYKWKEDAKIDPYTFCKLCLEDTRGIECRALDSAVWI